LAIYFTPVENMRWLYHFATHLIYIYIYVCDLESKEEEIDRGKKPKMR